MTEILVAAGAIIAAALLLIAGYLLGARQGLHARSQLRRQSLDQAIKLHQTREQLTYHQAAADTLRESTTRTLDVLVKQGEALQLMVHEMVAPLVRRDKEVEELRVVIQDILAPLMQREQLALELANLSAGSGDRAGLAHLLDEIGEKGRFEAVLLSDDAGLPLAASASARDLDKLAALSSMVLVFAERVGRGGTPAQSLVIHDAENRETLCRIFSVGGQRLLLTAVCRGQHLSSTTLDAALSQVDKALLPEVPA